MGPSAGQMVARQAWPGNVEGHRSQQNTGLLAGIKLRVSGFPVIVIVALVSSCSCVLHSLPRAMIRWDDGAAMRVGLHAFL